MPSSKPSSRTSRLLVKPGSRKRLQAMARLRSLAIGESLFPGVSTLTLSTEGTGLSVSLRITKK